MLWGVVFDCGSSGTRLHVYEWESAGGRVREVPTPKNESTITPGIGSFVDDPSGIAAYIGPLLALAQRAVPQASQPATRLIAQATAGMRLLTPSQQEPIWSALSTQFASTPFDFTEGDARTISGNYEGLYAWIAASYLDNVPYGEALGVLDYGGASTQIAFVPSGASPTLLQDAYRVRHGEQSTRVYSHSYMRGGQDQAMERMRGMLPGAGSVPTLRCPCHNRGFHGTWTVCSASGACRANTSVVGTGNWSECHRLTTALLHEEYECLLPPCAAFGVYQPSVSSVRMLATNGYFYTARGLGLVPSGAHSASLTRSDFVRSGEAFCARPWAEVSRNDTHASEYCFSSAYVPSLLRAFGLGARGRQVEYTERLGGSVLTWALGSQLYEISEQRREIWDAAGPGAPAALRLPDSVGARRSSFWSLTEES